MTLPNAGDELVQEFLGSGCSDRHALNFVTIAVLYCPQYEQANESVIAVRESRARPS